ncbi:MAG: hypothetical protein Q4F99_05885 [bacterium]|nr:hypothetical protein [bacterium]
MFYLTNNINLNEFRNMEICDYDKNTLVDLRDITVDKSQSVYERFESFMMQVRNPYLFKVGDVAVKVAYGDGKDFSKAFGEAVALA